MYDQKSSPTPDSKDYTPIMDDNESRPGPEPLTDICFSQLRASV